LAIRQDDSECLGQHLGEEVIAGVEQLGLGFGLDPDHGDHPLFSRDDSPIR
jgi:hypothetical protein